MHRIAWGLGLAAAGWVAAQPGPLYDFTPASAPAGQAFTLKLLSEDFTCATAFDSLSVVLNGGTLTLTFSDRELPKGCGSAGAPPAPGGSYGPAFAVPALKAGDYPILANRLSNHTLAQAGTLQVTAAAARTRWYLKEEEVPADRAFTLRLLRDDIGSCHTSFSHEEAAVTGAGILASFVRETDSGRVCIVDVRPFGPSFPMAALKPGLYPVLPYELMPCQVAQPACLPPVQVPEVTDTLLVTRTLAVRLSDLRARAPRIELRDGRAVFTLPEGGAGTWRAEWAAPDGRSFYAEELQGSTGGQASILTARAPASGLILLRLTGPDGAQSVSPLPRR